MRKKVGFISLGCSKALSDSEKVMYFLKESGSIFSPTMEGSDLVVINTCSFIEAAVMESMDTIGEALDKSSRVIVMGCLASTQADKIKSTYPNVLEVISDQEPDQVIEVLRKYVPESKKELNLDASQRAQLTPKHYAYLKISEGCNNKCTFCLIPTIKGELRSKSKDLLIQEARSLVKNGVKELILIAQDTIDYEGDKTAAELIDLIKELATLNVWIRLHYIYPYKSVEKLIELMAQDVILPYLDMPLQHISPNVLRRMQRPGEYTKILEKINAWRTICPELKIRTSFILGFPGETEEDFSLLLRFLIDAKFDRVGFFKYSNIDGIKARNLDGHLDEDTIEQRYARANEVQQQISKELLAQQIGEVIEVIVDEFDEKNKISIARTKGDSPEADGLVYVKNSNRGDVGQIIKVKITNSYEYDLEATSLKKVIN